MCTTLELRSAQKKRKKKRPPREQETTDAFLNSYVECVRYRAGAGDSIAYATRCPRASGDTGIGPARARARVCASLSQDPDVVHATTMQRRVADDTRRRARGESLLFGNGEFSRLK